MAIYHITKAGNPGICRAQHGKCPFGGDDSHYTSKEAAWEAIEKSNESAPKRLSKSKAPRKTPLERAEDELNKANKELKAIEKIKRAKMKEFTAAEKAIREGLLSGSPVDSKYHEIYKKAEIENKVLDDEHKKRLKAVQDKQRAAQAARPVKKSPSASSPSPTYEDYNRGYYGCGGGGGGRC